MVHLWRLCKIKAKTALVLCFALGLLVYTVRLPQRNMVNEARNAVVIFNQIRPDISRQQPSTSGDSTRKFFNDTNTSLSAFSSLATTKSPVPGRLISVELVGAARLGNLMFGHASMLGMAHSTGLDPIVSDRNRLLLESFNLATPHKPLETSNWSVCHEKFASAYDETLLGRISNSDRRVLLFGYYQSWRYFDHIRLRITKEFRFKSRIAESAAKFLEAATLKHYPSSAHNRTLRNGIHRVGIHVRRGDMLAMSSVFKGFTVANKEYMARAMAYMEKRLLNRNPYILYVVVSDDVAWCRSNVISSTHPIEFSSGNNEASVDLAILASCDHTIVSVGTFGWWAAYLAGGITVYYKDFPANGSDTAKVFRSEDYFPPTWVGL